MATVTREREALKLTVVVADIGAVAAGAMDRASYRTVVVALTDEQCAALALRHAHESFELVIVERVE